MMANQQTSLPPTTQEAGSNENKNENNVDKAAASSSTSSTDATGIKKGSVLWYNVEKKYGFIVLDQPDGRIMRVHEAEIQAEGQKALQTSELVEIMEGTDERGLCLATKVTGPNRKPVSFEKKINRAPSGPRYILFSPQGPPPAGLHPMVPPPSQRRHPQPEINPDKILTGIVTRWNNSMCYGFIQPDDEGDKRYSHVFVHQSAIESSGGYRGLKVGCSVRFRVGTTEHSRGKPTAIKVTDADGAPLKYFPPHVYKKMMRSKKDPDDEKRKFDLVSDEVLKGTVKWFSWKKGYGFIQPDGKEDKEANHVFVHMVETDFMPLKEKSRVEYQLGKNSEGKLSALNVTGQNGGPIEIDTKRQKVSFDSSTSPVTGTAAGGAASVNPETDGEQHQQQQPNPNPISNLSPPVPAGGGTLEAQAWAENGATTSNVIAAEAPVQQSILPESPQQAPQKSSGTRVGKKRKQPETFNCEICKKAIVGENQYESHIAGKAHKHKAEMIGMEMECTICNVTFSGRAHRDSHINGRKHQQAINPGLVAPMPKRRYYHNYRLGVNNWRWAAHQAQTAAHLNAQQVAQHFQGQMTYAPQTEEMAAQQQTMQPQPGTGNTTGANASADGTYNYTMP